MNHVIPGALLVCWQEPVRCLAVPGLAEAEQERRRGRVPTAAQADAYPTPRRTSHPRRSRTPRATPAPGPRQRSLIGAQIQLDVLTPAGRSILQEYRREPGSKCGRMSGEFRGAPFRRRSAGRDDDGPGQRVQGRAGPGTRQGNAARFCGSEGGAIHVVSAVARAPCQSSGTPCGAALGRGLAARRAMACLEPADVAAGGIVQWSGSVALPGDVRRCAGRPRRRWWSSW